MKGYILFLIFVIGSLAAAADNNRVIGYVRITDSQEALRTPDLIIRIKYIYLDQKKPEFVVLVPLKEDAVDALVVNFNRFREKGLVSNRFRNALVPGFVIDISAKDLVFDSSRFMSILKVDANNIASLTQNGRSTAIKECSRKNTQGWNLWTSDIQLPDTCL